MDQIFFNKNVNSLSGEIIFSLRKNARVIGYPHKKIELNLCLTAYIKTKSKWIIDLNVK